MAKVLQRVRKYPVKPCRADLTIRKASALLKLV